MGTARSAKRTSGELKQRELAKRVVAKQQVCGADKGRAAQSGASQPVQAVDCGHVALQERALGRPILIKEFHNYLQPTRDVFTESVFLQVSAPEGSCPAMSRLSLDLGGVRCVLIVRTLASGSYSLHRPGSGMPAGRERCF